MFKNIKNTKLGEKVVNIYFNFKISQSDVLTFKFTKHYRLVT